MFRSLLYLYEFKVAPQQKAPWIDRWNYFFFLPNLAMPIFPILDWRNFRDNWAPRPDFNLALSRIANGILHFMLYRVIYHYAPLNPLEIAGPWDVLAFNASSYLLIVRLAGMFHLAVGIGGLFGWQLPRVFEHYFFARNFNDLWQRINRYWRDFVMRVIYYPFYFRVKKWGRDTAMVFTLGLTFLLNWFLHSWQFLWLKGDFPVTIQDGIFWGGFGLVVIANSIYTTRFKPQRPEPALEAMQITGVFWVMSLLWTLWTHESLGSWWELMSRWRIERGPHPLVASLAMAGLSFLIAWGFVVVNSKWPRLLRPKPFLSHAFLLVFAGVVAGVVRMEASGPVWSNQLNDADDNEQFNGYYEEIVPPNSLLATTIGPKGGKSSKQNFDYLNLYRPSQCLPLDTTLSGRGDFQFQTNRHGHRAPNCAHFPDDHKFRFVLLGGSMELGLNSPDDSTLAQLAEDQLNAHLREIDSPHRVEIICTAVGRAGCVMRLHQWLAADSLYHPDCILYPLHARDFLQTKHIQKHRRLTEHLSPEWTAIEKKAWTIYSESFSPHNDDGRIQEIGKHLPELLDKMLSNMSNISTTPCIVVEFDSIASAVSPQQSTLNRIACWKSRENGKSQGVMTQVSSGNVHFNSKGNELNARDLVESLWDYLNTFEQPKHHH